MPTPCATLCERPTMIVCGPIAYSYKCSCCQLCWSLSLACAMDWSRPQDSTSRCARILCSCVTSELSCGRNSGNNSSTFFSLSSRRLQCFREHLGVFFDSINNASINSMTFQIDGQETIDLPGAWCSCCCASDSLCLPVPGVHLRMSLSSSAISLSFMCTWHDVHRYKSNERTKAVRSARCKDLLEQQAEGKT